MRPGLGLPMIIIRRRRDFPRAFALLREPDVRPPPSTFANTGMAKEKGARADARAPSLLRAIELLRGFRSSGGSVRSSGSGGAGGTSGGVSSASGGTRSGGGGIASGVRSDGSGVAGHVSGVRSSAFSGFSSVFFSLARAGRESENAGGSSSSENDLAHVMVILEQRVDHARPKPGGKPTMPVDFARQLIGFKPLCKRCSQFCHNRRNLGCCASGTEM